MNSRQEMIYKLIQDRKFISIDDLSKLVHYSASTIRRDLHLLESLKLIKKVAGGALHLKNDLIENPTELKYQINSKYKKEIADSAVNFIEDYSTIFLDSSSSSQYLANLLILKRGLKIFTTNISTAELLDRQDNNHEVYFIGGKLSNGKVSGTLTESSLRNLYFEQSFLSCRGIDKNGFASELLEEEATLKYRIMTQSKQLFLLADHSKFNASFTFRSLNVKQVTYVITDSAFSNDIKKDYENYSIVIASD